MMIGDRGWAWSNRRDAAVQLTAVQITQGEAAPMKPSSKAAAMTRDTQGTTPSAPVKAAAMTDA
jgi:hypothetical protein